MVEIEPPYKAINTPISATINYKGADFKAQTWKVPEGTPLKGKIVYVHGFAESSGLYVKLFDQLSTYGYQVFFFSQRGAPETSPGKQLGVTNETLIFDDLDYFIKYNLDQSPKSDKLFLLGHSMGGGIILNYAIKGTYRNQINGIVCSGPLVLLHPTTQPNIIVRTFAGYINYLVPHLKVDSKLNHDLLTSDEDWKQYIIKHDKKLIGTVRQFHHMFQRGEKLLDKSYTKNFNTPVLVFHGEIDEINDPVGTKKFFETLDYKDSEFVPVKGARHSLFIESEPIYKDIYGKLTQFLDSH
ncbi:Alpha/Beta hydrolase protein [Scheffersomyces coipomensis]|uniref:Alpha/Beta hydrolase protein n=1 Tax=Scheffersomyces coipomensis TaxID=1788519 RepID=UPI00315DF049